MLSERQKRKAAGRLKPGNGRTLRGYRWWQPLSRALFHLVLTGGDGRRATYSVDVPYWQRFATEEGEGKAQLYVDGRQHSTSVLPAVFPVPGGRIEVVPTAFGLRRCHYVDHGGVEHRLTPDVRSAEGRRSRFQRSHPGTSRLLAALSLTLLLVSLGLAVPQIVEALSQVPPVAERFGTFDSPVALTWWANTALGLCASAASVERATRLRYSPLLDGTE
ncbi:hypothetical protein [Streptomyces spiramenti]|uniref:Uncharacterized protein n=1 Tax=Streptomyces spiramenti TaxID=2720606 RepID=A0ABX1AJ14_9ACTN|nr:hypothetical protein [Streptomyces spiramenti]NJP65926.1 hypothetical protein [Streptomyces spiramenti]